MPWIEIHLLEGRDADTKRRLMCAVTDAVEEALGAPRERIRVWIHEVPSEHYMVGGRPALGPTGRSG